MAERYEHPDFGVQYLRGDPDRHYTSDMDRGADIIGIVLVGLLFAPIAIPAWIIGRIARRWFP